MYYLAHLRISSIPYIYSTAFCHWVSAFTSESLAVRYFNSKTPVFLFWLWIEYRLMVILQKTVLEWLSILFLDNTA